MYHKPNIAMHYCQAAKEGRIVYRTDVTLVILKYAGSDATQAYNEVHAPGIIDEAMARSHFKGQIDPLSVPKKEESMTTPTSLRENKESQIVEKSKPEIPHLHTLLSVADFEAIAQKKFTAKTFAFYSSAATDLISHCDNLESFRSLLIRPRVLRNVKNVSISRRILGYESSAPFFVSPAAMARLAHPDGELAIARACAEDNVIQIISSNASYPLQDIVAAGRPGQTFFLQLYVNSERKKTEELLIKARDLGIKAIFVTVDAPIPGKREADERISAENFVSAMSGAVATNDKKGGGLGRVMAQYIDSSLTWEDLTWIRRVSGLPIFLKGVQTAADAKLAAQHGCEGILLSNHGGRSLDT
jgi:L-lactate dehydrogenase (cytochrome)